MSVTDLAARARQANSPSGAKINTAELRALWAEAKAPVAGEPAGKPVTPEEAAVLRGINASELTTYARNNVLPGILAEIPALLQNGVAPGGVVSVPAKRGHAVFLSPAGIATDAQGSAPATTEQLIGVLHNAGKWMQASFGGNDNVFALLDTAAKSAVVRQLQGALAINVAALPQNQREQLLGSAMALAVELTKSITFVPQMPAQNAQLLALRDAAFAVITGALDHAQVSALVARGMLGYLNRSDSARANFTNAQRTNLQVRGDAVAVKAPADYAAWEAQGKNRIVIDHVAGAGENFVFGIVKQLQADGINPKRQSSPLFVLRGGNPDNGPAVLEAVLAANHPLNSWGREMTVEVRVREMNRDMYRAMGDAGVDVIHYGGHSNLGYNTLQSLQNAPAQNGAKVILRDLCAGADTRNAEAHVYPDAARNSVTSVGSSYFRTTDDARMGSYAYESEGYEMLMCTVRGLLGKKDWDAIAPDLKNRANWGGHATDNNWSQPGDPRVASEVDDDKDGVPNVFDLLPAYDTTDVVASTAQEFALAAPTIGPDSINGTRVFQALQFLNTHAAYNDVLERLNEERLVHADPTGLFFDAKDDVNTYVKWRRGPNNERFAQVSSALADMTLESLRAVMFMEFVREVGRENPALFANKAEQTAMGLVFASSALAFDDSFRDTPIFDGIKRMYGVPQTVALGPIEAARATAENDRHNYTGDRVSAAEVAARYAAELGGARVGDPALAVTV